MEDYKAEQESDGSETVLPGLHRYLCCRSRARLQGGCLVRQRCGAERRAPTDNCGKHGGPDIQVRFDPIGEAITYGFRPDGVDGKAQISAVFRADGSNTDVDFAAGSTPATDGQLTVSVSDLCGGL